jgi:hypothetical protein
MLLDRLLHLWPVCNAARQAVTVVACLTAQQHYSIDVANKVSVKLRYIINVRCFLNSTISSIINRYFINK